MLIADQFPQSYSDLKQIFHPPSISIHSPPLQTQVFFLYHLSIFNLGPFLW